MGHHYTRESVKYALQKIGLKKGDIVFSHSNVGFLGIPEGGFSLQNVTNTLLEAFFDVIGEEGTLIVPTFTYSFSQEREFDPDNTPSTCGMFTEAVRNHSMAQRSEDPCVSVAGMGAKAKELLSGLSENAYGHNSFFDRLYKADGVICNINFDAGSTFIHYVERCLNVPYRFDKTFVGRFKRNERIETRSSTIFVRKMINGTSAQFESFDRIVRQLGIYKTVTVGRGFIGAITAREVFSILEETLPLRPWLLTEAETFSVMPDMTQYEGTLS